jgi:tight adherence protein B
MLIALATFVVILLLVLGVYWVAIVRPEAATERALGRRLRLPSLANVLKAPIENEATRLSTVPLLDRLLARFTSLDGPLQQIIEQSSLSVTLGQLVLATLFGAALGVFLVIQFAPNVWLALAAGGLLAAVPYFVVRRAARRRIERFEEQFPEAVDLIARALRAGHALTTGLGLVCEELPDPVRAEFQLLHDRQNYGMPLPDALRDFARRVPLVDARFFATAVLTQRESGGNLAEVLDGLSAIIRDRFRLKRQVRVLSAHGRITGTVLTLMPVVIGAVMWVMAPVHFARLFSDPLGIRMVAAAAILQVVGFIWMRRIVNIEV